MDPGYEKGERLRNQIYEEYPFLHPDPEFHSRPIKPRPIVFKPLPPKPKIEPKIIKVYKLAIPDLVNCIVSEYHSDGNGRMKDLLLPCSVEFSKGEKKNQYLHCKICERMYSELIIPNIQKDLQSLTLFEFGDNFM